MKEAIIHATIVEFKKVSNAVRYFQLDVGRV